MDYLWLKAFHIAVVVAWIGGMLINSLVIGFVSPNSAQTPRTDTEQRLIATVRNWDRRVTTPAMFLVWILGATLAVMGGWFWSPWLLIKLFIVFALSGLHGVQLGTLRWLASEADRRLPSILRFSAPIVLAAVVIIAILVETQPF